MRHRSGAVEADIIEAAQRVAVAQHDDRIVAYFRGEERSGLTNLLQSPDELPSVREDPLALELEVDGIDVESRRNCGRTANVGIEGENEGHVVGSVFSFQF